MLIPASHPLVAGQLGNNQDTRLAWQQFSGHRLKVMNLIKAARHEDAASIAILGAGNCNDLDLFELADAFPAVHLFDLDAEAIEYGIASQGVVHRQNIHRHAPFDVTGCLQLLAPYFGRPLTQAEFQALLEAFLSSRAPATGDTYDVVVSDCILSQIISTLGQLKLTQEQLVSLTLAVRYQHLRTLLDWLRPAGRLVFITDVVSSDTLPELPRLRETEWLPALRQCLQTANFITGLNPEMVSNMLQTEPYFRQHEVNYRFIAPWRWDISDNRAYLVYACLISFANR
jgi:hypothetical protein